MGRIQTPAQREAAKALGEETPEPSEEEQQAYEQLSDSGKVLVWLRENRRLGRRPKLRNPPSPPPQEHKAPPVTDRSATRPTDGN